MPWHVAIDQGERAAARQAPDRHDASAASARPTRTRRRGSGSASRTCSTRRSCARRSRSRSPRRTSGSSASTAPSRSSSRSSRRATRATRSGCGRTSPTRRCSSTARCATGKRVLFEGAQGDAARPRPRHVSVRHLVEHGRRRAPRSGIGIGPTRIDAVIGVAKAYVTRVGEGPFPTEIEGADQERVRELGGEFGTVTGPRAPLRLARPRRAALRGAAERDHLARADEARRALGVRRAAGLRALPAARRDRDGRLPGAPERLPPLPSRSTRRCRAGRSRSTR